MSIICVKDANMLSISMEETVIIEMKTNDQSACDYLQGFYFSKPLPQAEFVKFIKK